MSCCAPTRTARASASSVASRAAAGSPVSQAASASGNGDRCDPQQLTRGLGERTRLHEERDNVRVTSPGTRARHNRERERAW